MPATHTYCPSSKIPAKMIHVDARNPRRCMNPLTGILPPRGDALGYRYASPNGDGGRGNQHFGVLHVSAATPPQCDGATTTLLSPHYTLHSFYTFSAKERDSETGFSYFGSRYYSSDLSIWLSVDPMSGKYPSLSPYVYCANNPVKLVDPNGEEMGDYFDQYGTFLGTDCKDDGKIHIIDREFWNQIGDNMSWEGNDGIRVISHDLASDEHNGIFSKKPSEANLSDESVVNIFEHYNQSAYSCLAMERGSSDKLDNGVFSGLTTDHKQKKIKVRIDGNINSKVIDNYNEIINLLQHEEQHVEDRIHKIYGTDKQSEERAILRQIQHPTFAKTRESFQNAVYEYARTLDISF